jgi:hypothetical protein
MCDDEELVSMLRILHEADEACEPIDSQAVARRLGWADERTANLLTDARARLGDGCAATARRADPR